MPDQEEFFDDVKDVSWVMGTCLGHPGTLFVVFHLFFFFLLHLDTACWFFLLGLVGVPLRDPCMDYCWLARVSIQPLNQNYCQAKARGFKKRTEDVRSLARACSSQCACVNIQSLLQVGHCLHTRWLSYCDEHASGNFGGGSANGCNHGARADSCRLCKAGFLGVAENKRRWR